MKNDLLCEKQHAQTGRAAVTGYGAAGAGNENFFERMQFFHGCYYLIKNLGGNTGVCYEYPLCVEVISAVKSAVYVGQYGLFHITAVFFANLHLAVNYLNFRVKL